MIDVKELRVGNLFQDEDNTPCYFAGVWPRTDGWMIRDSANNTYKPMQVYPIPLSPELMPACGFHRRPDVRFDIFFNDKVLFESWPLDGSIVIEGGFVGQKIKHLHQLQNLYFALTGIELVVNLAKINS